MQTSTELKSYMKDILAPVYDKVQHMRSNIHDYRITPAKQKDWIKSCDLTIDYLNRIRLSTLDMLMQEKLNQWAQTHLNETQRNALLLTNINNDKLQVLESNVIDLANAIIATESVIKMIKEKLNDVCRY